MRCRATAAGYPESIRYVRVCAGVGRRGGRVRRGQGAGGLFPRVQEPKSQAARTHAPARMRPPG